MNSPDLSQRDFGYREGLNLKVGQHCQKRQILSRDENGLLPPEALHLESSLDKSSRFGSTFFLFWLKADRWLLPRLLPKPATAPDLITTLDDEELFGTPPGSPRLRRDVGHQELVYLRIGEVLGHSTSRRDPTARSGAGTNAFRGGGYSSSTQ